MGEVTFDTLNAQADPNCIVMLSMSLLMYDGVGHTGEYVLLNNKGFSPCAIIAAYPAENPIELNVEPLKLSKEAYPDRYMKMEEMGYDGNRLLRALQKRTWKIEMKHSIVTSLKESTFRLGCERRFHFSP